ncbi:MAG: FHA domain-containing protein [Candidatus Ancillula sp.]|nr:FHA domain-containing protein [Candidatus Ancillula sp.]
MAEFIKDATSIGLPKITDSLVQNMKTTPELDAQIEENAAVLVVVGANEERFLIDKDVSKVGRSENVDVFLNSHSVSREHAEIERRNGEFIITDLGSLNGTYVNMQVIESPTVLRSGDNIRIGKFTLRFLCG